MSTDNTLQPKRYRLLKDLPRTKAGAIVEANTYGIPVTAEQVKHSNWPLFYSEGGSMMNEFIPISYLSNPEWFSPVPEHEQPSRVEVRDIGIDNYFYMGEDTGHYVFSLSQPISKDKFPAIKKAIEDVLNDSLLKQPDISMGMSEPYIQLTKEQLDGMIENVFNAARKLKPQYGKVADGFHQYPRFENYKYSGECYCV